jgi:hypothetical protein
MRMAEPTQMVVAPLSAARYRAAGRLMRRLRQLVVALHLRGLRRLYRDRPVPLGYWEAWWRALALLFRCPDCLAPRPEALVGAGASLQVPVLRDLLRDDRLGEWALDCASIERLWSALHQERPTTLVECGAGASSLVLGQYAAGVAMATGPVRVFSLEQDEAIQQRVAQRVRMSGLAEYVQLIHLPVREDGEYVALAERLPVWLGTRRIDFVLIDGPAGPAGCRRGTLPALARWCRAGARWFLDDAFRDGEFQILRTWAHTPGIRVDGIYPIGKGLATGIVTCP